VVSLYATAAHAEAPITLCDLAKDPAAYDRKVVEITAFVSHGFEDFTLFDPLCSSDEPRVWLESGGTFASGTIYCCGLGSKRSRPAPLVVEDVPIPIVLDAKLKQFDKLVHRDPDSVVHATIRGHFFSSGKEPLSGFGHFGLFSLLTIEQVVRFDPHDLHNVDYRAAPDQPELGGVGCFAQPLGETSYSEAIQEQRAADSGENERFNNPSRVASDVLFRLLQERPVSLKQQRRTAGRVVYDAKMPGSSNRHMVVVSRPYWLSFFAKDRRNVAWTVIAVWESGCPEKKQTPLWR